MTLYRLKELRLEAGKTQEEIARILNCKRNVYRCYEMGIHKLPTWALIKLAVYYGTSTDNIMDMTDQREPHAPPKKHQ